MQRNFKRVTVYPIEQVLPLIQEAVKKNKRVRNPERTISLAGFKVNATSLRLQLFATRPLVCVACQAVPTHFGLDFPRDKSRPHLNLYGKSKNGKELLFTKDHIIEKSKGGPDRLRNLQIMCSPCNGKKSAKPSKPRKGETTVEKKLHKKLSQRYWIHHVREVTFFKMKWKREEENESQRTHCAIEEAGSGQGSNPTVESTPTSDVLATT